MAQKRGGFPSFLFPFLIGNGGGIQGRSVSGSRSAMSIVLTSRPVGPTLKESVKACGRSEHRGYYTIAHVVLHESVPIPTINDQISRKPAPRMPIFDIGSLRLICPSK